MTRAVLNRSATEAEFQDAVIELAKLSGWLVHHTRPAQTAKGWRTPLQGDKGFPDLVLAHQGYGLVILAELKSERGRVSADQAVWALTLRAAARRRNAVEYRLWRPSDWDEIVRHLTKGETNAEEGPAAAETAEDPATSEAAEGATETEPAPRPVDRATDPRGAAMTSHDRDFHRALLSRMLTEANDGDHAARADAIGWALGYTDGTRGDSEHHRLVLDVIADAAQRSLTLPTITSNPERVREVERRHAALRWALAGGVTPPDPVQPATPPPARREAPTTADWVEERV